MFDIAFVSFLLVCISKSLLNYEQQNDWCFCGKPLITAWNTFSHDYPGECRRICLEGLDAYHVADILKKQGMYRAKIIDED